MRSIVLVLGIWLAVSTSLQAQKYSFVTVNRDTFYVADTGVNDMHLRIKNNTVSTLGIQWTLLESSLDASRWGGFAFCDPSLCYYNVNKGEWYTTEVEPQGIGDFKLSIKAKGSARVDSFSIIFRETGSTAPVDTLTYIVDARPLGVSEGIRPVKNLEIYPNPVVHQLWLDLPGLKTITIFDLQGRAVMNQVVTGNFIPVEGLMPGIYMLHAVRGNEVYRTRFVRE